MKQLISIHNDLLIQRYLNGIELVNPKEGINPSHVISNIAEMFKLPINIHFTNSNGIIENINETTAEICGFTSALNAVGRTVADVATQESVEFERQHDLSVMTSRSIKIADENFMRLDGTSIIVIAIKIPWYYQSKIVGVFGCGIVADDHKICSIANAMDSLQKIGLLTFQGHKIDILPGFNIDGVYLTKRERDCVRLLIRGKTSKEIAHILGLSQRSIQHFIENIKNKTGAINRSDLIEKIFDELDM